MAISKEKSQKESNNEFLCGKMRINGCSKDGNLYLVELGFYEEKKKCANVKSRKKLAMTCSSDVRQLLSDRRFFFPPIQSLNFGLV